MNYLQRKKGEIITWIQNFLDSKLFSAFKNIWILKSIGNLGNSIQNYLKSEEFKKISNTIKNYLESEDFKKFLTSLKKFLYGVGSEVLLHFIDKALQKLGVPERYRTILKWILDIASSFCIAWWMGDIMINFVILYCVKKLVTFLATNNAKGFIDWVFY